MDALTEPRTIRTQPRPSCRVCGSAGDLIYVGLVDSLFGAPGEWSMRRCGNRGCRLLWLDPQPTSEDIGMAYATYFTHEERSGAPSLPKRIFRQVRASYLRSSLGYTAATSKRGWRLLAPVSHLLPGGGASFAAGVMFLPAQNASPRLLDVGCGGGDFIAGMQGLGWNVSGIETDPIAVKRAQSRGLDVHLGEVWTAELAEESFDAITMAHVIEHVHDPARVLARCRRLLKANGTLVVTTPNSESWGHRRFGRDWLSLDPPRHLHLFNRDNIATLLHAAGLHPVRIASLAINASAVWPTSAAIRRKRSAGTAETLTLRTTPGGIARQVAERMRLTVDESVGEDLLAIAKRTV
ncbi:MAG TPA: class I SAM-dependent methyltransferase [Candidatus Dormibacteraeota bacterium]|nr:class I SAM-dependent methyltransferase [Candidatus Dormibacteraeota bacterium]